VIVHVDGVAETAVVGAPDERWGEAVTALVVRAPSGPEVTADDITAACRAELAGYKKPLRVEFVAELPRTSTGKLNRRALHDRFWAGRERRVGE
jgi:acyl-CoA synthetase (AMP-forming)/AMP-acid ligase II